MDKILIYPSSDSLGQHLRPIDLDDPRSIDGLDKAAGVLHPSVRSFIDSWEPMDGHTAWLIDALGSDVYGNNINGDRFPREMLSHEGKDYGHKTFEHFGYPFFHHINKDPKFAYGPKVPLAVWQAEMERVQVVAWWSHELCGDLMDRLLDGEVIDVSMGCFIAGTLITMADGTRKPIEDIRIGDMVLTHLGRVRRVSELHRRSYKGEVHTIRGEAGMSTRGTRQHPYWVTPLESVKKNWKTVRWLDDAKVEPDWVHTECLGNEHLLQPVIRGVETPGYVTREFARFFGYYLAEGHPLFNAAGAPVAVQFSTHPDDAIHQEMGPLCDALDSRNPPNTWPRKNSDLSLAIDVYDPRLAELCIRHGGHGARDKVLSDGAILWHPEMQREMLGAYANGDGCGSGDSGTLRWSTASAGMAFQIVEVLHRIGVIPSICSLTHKAGSGFSRRNTEEWVVHLGKGFAQGFRDVCAKVAKVDIIKTKSGRKLIDDYVVTPIRDHEVLYGETEVFNFEVEEDESYVANGYAVHNCRVPFDECTVCGNKARKRSQYCDHLRSEMNKLYPNGVRVGAINWYPKFFDISRVVRGAEKCSKFMVPIGVSFRRGRILKTADISISHDHLSSAELFEKVAGALPDDVELRAALTDLDAKVADEKTADIEKQVQSNLTPSPEACEMSEDLLEGMGKLRRMEPDIPPELLNSMGAEHPLKSILTTMLGLGVVPKPKEFQRLVLVSIGRKDVADKYEREGQCFGEHDHEGQETDVDLSSVLGGPKDLSPDIGKLLGPLLAGRSAYKPALAGRTMVIIKRAAAGPINFNELDERERKPLPLGALAVGLAALHGAFKQKMTGGGMAALGSAAAKNPVLLALITALGVGAVEAHRQVAVTRSNPFAQPLEKMGASGMGTMTRFLGLPAAAYIYADMQEAKRIRGERTTRSQEFARANPDLTSLALVLGAPALLRGARGGLRGVGSLLKHSSLLGEIGSTIPMYALFAKAGPALPLAATGAALDVAIFEGLGKLLGSRAEELTSA